MSTSYHKAGRRARLPGAFCVLSCVLLLFSAAVPAAGASDGEGNRQGDERPEYVPGEVLIKFNDDASSDTVKKASKDVEAKELKEFKTIGVKHWKLGDDCSVDDAIKKLEKDYKDDLEFVEPNYYHYADATVIPSDTYRAELYGMHNIGQTGGTTDADIDALEAWSAGKTGSSSVVVGVIDSGIDYNHEDLADNMWKNPGETGTDGNGKDRATNGVDDDGNGYKDDVYGWDFANNDNDPMDDNGHGTHTAGTVGAVGNNGKGVAGVCWSVKLMALKFLGAGGSGTTTAAISAVNYAAWFKDANGKNIVRVTSNSWGGGVRSSALETAITNSGALFVASAGNSGSSQKQYPAGYAADNIISVAATDHNDGLASFSNYGSTWVDLGAPGVNTLSSVPSNAYGFKSGTSMACPHVSGAAALIMASDGSLTNAQVKAKIMDNVDSVSSLSGKTATGGRLNVARALGAGSLDSDSNAPGTVGSLLAGTTTETTIPFTWTATGDDGSVGTAYYYDIRYVKADSFPDASWPSATQVQQEPGPKSYGGSESFMLTGLEAGTKYTIRIRSGDELGNAGGLSDSLAAATQAAKYSVDSSMDANANVNFHALALDKSANRYPAIAYQDINTDTVKFAHWNGQSWDVQTVDTGVDYGWGVGMGLGYDNDGKPGLSYTDANGVLEYAHWNGNSWDRETIEGQYCKEDEISFAYDSSGNPSVAYFKQGYKSGKTTVPYKLMFAKKSGGSWTTQTVESGALARYKSLAYYGGYPAIAYCDDLNADNYYDAVKYASWDGSKWNVETIDSYGPLGTGTALALGFDGSGQPNIVSRHIVSGNIYDIVLYAKGDSGWTETVIARDDFYPWGFSLACASDGDLYLSYGTNNGIVVARGTPAAGWTFEHAAPGRTNWETCLALDGSDNPSLTYTQGSGEYSAGVLAYAKRR